MKQLGKLYVDLFYFRKLTGNVTALPDTIFDFLALPPELLAVFLKLGQLCGDIFKGKKPVFFLRFRRFRFHVQRVHDAFASSEQLRAGIDSFIRVQSRYVLEHAHSVFRLQRVVAGHIFIDKIIQIFFSAYKVDVFHSFNAHFDHPILNIVQFAAVPCRTARPLQS